MGLLGIFVSIQYVASVHSSNQQGEALRSMLAETIIKGIQFDETPLEEAIERIHAAAFSENAFFRSVDFEIHGVPPDTPITLDLRAGREMPVAEALRYTSAIAISQFTIRKNEVWIVPLHFDSRPYLIQLLENSRLYFQRKFKHWREVIRDPSAQPIE